MRCETFIDMMDDLVDATLPQSDHKRLAEHLKQCADCRERSRSMRSLLTRSASLPRSVMPDKDLWPGIARKIILAGPPEQGSHQNTTSQSGSGWHSTIRFDRRAWLVAAAAVAGLMVFFAVTRLSTRPAAPKRPPAAADFGQTKQNPQAPAMPGPPPPVSSQTPLYQRAGTGSSAGGRTQEAVAQSCQCGPSAKILGTIDEAWMFDENLSAVRRSEAVSERLYNLAVENGDDFFLHKASLEARLIMLRAHDDLVNRYRTRLEQHPGDPDSIYLYAYSLLGKNTPEMIRLMRQLMAENPKSPWPNLALAEVYQYFDYADRIRFQTYLKAFMKLCPDSPEPTRLLAFVENSTFLADTLKRMRELLAVRSDTRSLLLYQEIWYLESIRQSSGGGAIQGRQRIGEDLKRLRTLEGRQDCRVRSASAQWLSDDRRHGDLPNSTCQGRQLRRAVGVRDA